MPSDEAITIKMLPFPRLVWTGFHWEGIVHLEGWRGFIPIQDLCPWITHGILADGDFRLNVNGSAADDGKPMHPTREQVVSFQHLLSNQDSIRDAILQAVFTEYPQLRESYADFVDEEAMPDISNAQGLMRLIRPGSVYVMAHPKDGFAPIGFGFSCSWDEEHGVGIMTHKGNVIAIGESDEAFSESFTGP